SGALLEVVLPWLDRWIDPHDPIAHPVILVSGDVLKTVLGIPASPIIGELLTAIRLAQVDGIVQDRETAIVYAHKLYQSSHQYPTNSQGNL
ncbi:MAG: hypothetical protein HC770_09305, partial [Pseudanabaena sp. CRU_2_10]|nr:hypothetical protein [Pseudanabaena sp. CRU_2_10]